MTFKNRMIILLLILGAVLSFMGIKDLLVLWKEPVDVLNEDTSALENNMHVHTKVELVMDQFIEETSYDTVNGIKVSEEKESARYYALPYLKVEDDWIMIDKMVAIRVSAGNPACRTLETISDETYEWWFDETTDMGDYGDTTLEVDGRLRKMTEEEKGYLIDYITVAMECDRSEAEEYIVPYVILVENLKGAYPMTAIGLTLLMISVLIIIVSKIKEKQTAALFSRRPYESAKPEGTYYEPEDITTAPAAYGSMTYGTNTYGQNTYGSSESSQNTYSGYGNTGVTQSTNPVYGNTNAAPNANPLYGNTTAAQNTNANPLYGNTTAAQNTNANPLYGNTTAAQNTNANPLYGNTTATQNTNANPLYGNTTAAQNTNANPLYGNTNVTQNANPLYENTDQ